MYFASRSLYQVSVEPFMIFQIHLTRKCCAVCLNVYREIRERTDNTVVAFYRVFEYHYLYFCKGWYVVKILYLVHN